MAKYVMQEAVDLNKEGKTLTYPKLIIGQCVDSNALAKQIASHTTFSRGEIVAVIDYLWSYMAENLGEGNSVKIDGLGVFTPSLAYRKGVERETEDGEGGRRNATSFCVGSINFRPEKKLMNAVNDHMHLTKAPGRFRRRVSPYTEEERLKRAKAFIEEHSVMYLADYVALSGLSRTTAYRELAKWSHEESTGILRTGNRTHAIYVLKK